MAQRAAPRRAAPLCYVSKVHDAAGGLHRLRYPPARGWEGLRAAMSEQLGSAMTMGCLTYDGDSPWSYVDNDGDPCVVDSDMTLVEAVELTRASGQSSLMLKACFVDGTTSGPVT
jgi:hypothetical protein